MTTPREPELTDELLSAYIDGAVTPEERQLIADVVATDPAAAWRLESLQMTVRLLHELPALALPRSFLLTPEQIGEPAGEPVAAKPAPNVKLPAPVPVRRASAPAAQPSFWTQLGTRWRDFWQNGSPALRNAMATSLVLLFVLVAGPRLMNAPLGGVVEAPAAAPAAEMAAYDAAAQDEVAAEDDTQVAAVAPTTTASQTRLMEAANAVPPAATQATAAQKAVAEEAVAEGAATETGASAPAAAEAAPMLALADAAPAAMPEPAQSVAQDSSPGAGLDAIGAAAAPSQEMNRRIDPLEEARQPAPGAAASGGGPSGAEMSAPVMAAAAAAPAAASDAAQPPAAPLPTATAAPSQTPTATPTVVPTATPTQGPPAAPVSEAAAAVVAGNQPAPAPLMPAPRAEPAMPPATATATPWLVLAQIAAGAGFVLFGLLWWRSRRR